MIHITAYRPSNGNIPEAWTQVNETVANRKELEEKRKQWQQLHNVPQVDIRYRIR
jgi:hypothetical protein